MSAPVPADIIAAAKASQAKWAIPASVSIAQWAVESGRGKHMPPGSNNPFGIKAVAGQPSVTVRTREVDRHGRDYYINAPFRKFASIDEAFDLHAKLLATGRPYVRARTKLPDANAFADALTGVYATDPHYGAALKTIMRGGNFYQYDSGSAVPADLQAPPSKRPTLRLGSHGEDVKVLQRALGILDDGQFGGGTERTLKAFQRAHGLTDDGIAGAQTFAALGL